MITGRREFLLAGAALGIGGAAGRTLLAADAEKAADDVSAVEDLMREHGVLRRILLIYEECVRRLDGEPKVADIVTASFCLSGGVQLVQRFIEDYHEKLEEKYLFPEFEKRGESEPLAKALELVPLVKVLKEQHVAGRALTKTLVHLSARVDSDKQVLEHPESRREAIKCCKEFIRMYRPHAAREDTVLFPAVKKLLSAKQLDELGDKFEDEENRLFGPRGFEAVVGALEPIDKQLGIYDLSQFTPKVAK
jgi:hemerythrin-like domain-containing protein